MDVCSVLNAIFSVLRQVFTWRNLLREFPNLQKVYTYFRNWQKDGT
ncbi:transposase [Nostoc sp. C117]